MGLRLQGYQRGARRKRAVRNNSKSFTIALAGNPNTGKTTVFNALTGLKQHTGNWPGKTVIQVKGYYEFNHKRYTVVDLPGTYSLFANSEEEQLARDFICFSNPDATVVVADAGCLERNLNLVLQVMEITDRVVICVNLLDEAKRKKIVIDLPKLSRKLGVPVVGTAARSGRGLHDLKQTLDSLLQEEILVKPKLPVYDNDIEEQIEALIPKIVKNYGREINPRWLALRLLEGDDSIFSCMKNYKFKKEFGYITKREALA